MKVSLNRGKQKFQEFVVCGNGKWKEKGRVSAQLKYFGRASQSDWLTRSMRSAQCRGRLEESKNGKMEVFKRLKMSKDINLVLPKRDPADKGNGLWWSLGLTHRSCPCFQGGWPFSMYVYNFYFHFEKSQGNKISQRLTFWGGEREREKKTYSRLPATNVHGWVFRMQFLQWLSFVSFLFKPY